MTSSFNRPSSPGYAHKVGDKVLFTAMDHMMGISAFGRPSLLPRHVVAGEESQADWRLTQSLRAVRPRTNGYA